MHRLLIALVLLVECAPALAGAPATSQKAGTVSLLWKGKELWEYGGGKFAGSAKERWQGMAGSSLGFRYSGKGALPAPLEFVIRLKEALPAGNYRLFVKNFYTGRMEATLGDITQPLKIRRYDWTPGQIFETNAPVDRITLRYFPSNIVTDTGAPQEQNYIVQGIFLTTETARVPIRDGQIVSVADEKPPEAFTGNYLRNGSFEVGLYPWGKPFGVPDALDAGNLDETTAADGTTSLKLAAPAAGQFGVESRSYRIPPGRYTLSFAAKSSRPVTIQASVQGLTEDLKSESPAGITKTFSLNDKWKRYDISGELRAAPGFLYCVRLIGKDAGEELKVWLDSIQLAPGEAREYTPRSMGSVGCISHVPGNIFYQGQSADVELLSVAPPDAGPAQISFRTTDYWGRLVDQGVTRASARELFKLFSKRCGLFRTTFMIGLRDDLQKPWDTSEVVYSVLPPNPHLEELYPQSSLGTDARFSSQQLRILKRANFNWAMSKFLGRWTIVEREEGKYQFDDAAMAAAREQHVCVMIQPLNIERQSPPWVAPYCKPAGGAAWEEQKKREYLRRWSSFVLHLVEHYRQDVHHWEIENEPNAKFDAEEYGDLLKAASEAIRKADPKATIIGFSGGGFQPSFYDGAMGTAGVDAYDIFSVHFYGNGTGPMQAFAQMLKRAHKSGWNTETGGTCPSFFDLLPEYDALQLSPKEAFRIHLDEVHTQAVHAVQNYLLSRSVAGMDKWFHYFSRGPNCSPSQPTARFGGGKELTEYDGSLRANAVAISIASHFFDGATYDSAIENTQLVAHLFRRGDGCIGFCWSANAQQVKLKAGVKGQAFWDLMGNLIESTEVSVGEEPVYFTFDGSPAALREAMSNAKR